MIPKGASRSTRRETQLRATLATTNPTRNGSRSNSGLRVGRERLKPESRYGAEAQEMWKNVSLIWSLISGRTLYFFKRFQIRPLVLLVRAAYRWRWVWSSGWMILTRENLNARRKTCLSSTLTTTDFSVPIPQRTVNRELTVGHYKNRS